MFSIMLPVCLSTAGSKSYRWKLLPAAADGSEQKCEVELNNKHETHNEAQVTLFSHCHYNMMEYE